MRIVITGGAGFLGSHLSDRCLAEGHEVVVVDNLITGNADNIAHINSPNFSYLKQNISEGIFVDGAVDFILHFASPASPVDYLELPIQTLKVGALGTHNALGLARAKGAGLLLASTSEVYGDPLVHPQKEDYWGNVNPIGYRGCYDRETEILTENGWVKFPELGPEIKVATLNPQGAVEYHVPDEYIVQRHQGELLHFANSKMDLLVTPNHKMYVRGKTGKLQFKRADEIPYAPSWRVPTGAVYQGPEREFFELGAPPRNAKVRVERVEMDVWLEFLGYYLSEGCVHVRRRTQTVAGRDYDTANHNVLIAQEKPYGRFKIAACLDQLGFKYFDSDHHQFRIVSKQLAEILLPLGKSGDKYIPREFLNLSVRQSRILFDALMLEDGTPKGEGYVYYSKSKQLADDVQELALRCGFAASVCRHAGRELFRVNIRPPREANLARPQRVPYDDLVYCVNVRHHVICVRRSGRAIWCGNCYDEAKRFAEAITMAYHRMHQIDTKIVRIFNSIMAHETVVAFHDGEMCVEPVEAFGARLEAERVRAPKRVQVPAFDPATGEMKLREADALIRYPSKGKAAFRLKTRYGRSIEVTADHSVFRRGTDGLPEAVPVSQMKVGDDVALPATLPVIERDRTHINLGARLLEGSSVEDGWLHALHWDGAGELLNANKEAAMEWLRESQRFIGSANRNNSAGCAFRKYQAQNRMPLALVAHLQELGRFQWPAEATLCPWCAGNSIAVPNTIEVSDDLLWLLGLYVAEGCHVAGKGDYRLILSSDEEFLRRAQGIFERSFGVTPRFVEASATRSPSLYCEGRLLLWIFESVFGVVGSSREARVPGWVMQLPLSRLKHFLDGYRSGDGTHTNLHEKRELAFNTVSEKLATDLVYLLLRFGVVASLGHYNTTFKARYGDRQFPFYRVTVCEVDDFDVLSWDRGVKQALNARRWGDLVWAKVKAIEPIESTALVYDFSVPGWENFVAGAGVCAHNTYGPRMRLQDGRIVPNFVRQALTGEPLTIYGDGTQTRSFCYCTDLVDGIYRLMMSNEHYPTNIGNPTEFTVKDFAELVIKLTGSQSTLTYEPLPQDDPKQRKPDISKAREVLGWKPKIELEEGLGRTLEYFRGRLGQ